MTSLLLSVQKIVIDNYSRA